MRGCAGVLECGFQGVEMLHKILHGRTQPICGNMYLQSSCSFLVFLLAVPMLGHNCICSHLLGL